MSSALSSYIRNLSIDNTVITSVSFDGLANSNDINIEYKDNDKTIWLSSGNGHVTSVDCTDFIKDGMLSSAELCGTILILNFNCFHSIQFIKIIFEDCVFHFIFIFSRHIITRRIFGILC